MDIISRSTYSLKSVRCIIDNSLLHFINSISETLMYEIACEVEPLCTEFALSVRMCSTVRSLNFYDLVSRARQATLKAVNMHYRSSCDAQTAAINLGAFDCLLDLSVVLDDSSAMLILTPTSSDMPVSVCKLNRLRFGSLPTLVQ